MRRSLIAVFIAVVGLHLACRVHSRHSHHATEVRFFHAAIDVDKLSFVVDGFVHAKLRRFEMSDYIRMFSGDRYLDIWEDGRLLVSYRLDVENGDEQTFILVGSKSARTLDLVQTIDPDGQAPEGKARVTFLHTSPDAPDLDLDIEGSTAVPGAGYLGQNVAPGWITIDADLLQFTVRESSGGRRRLGAFPFDAASRRDLTLAVVNKNNALELRVWDDYSGSGLATQSRFRILNASPEAGPLEIRLDGVVQAAGIPFRESSPYIPAHAGSRNLEIRAGGLTRVQGLVTLTGAFDYTVAVTGPATGLTAVLHTDGPFLADPDTFAFDVLHLGPDAGSIDVRVNGTVPNELKGLAFLGSIPTPTPPDALLLDLKSPADRTDIFEVLDATTRQVLARADLVPAEFGIYTVAFLGLRTAQGSLGKGDSAPAVLVFEEADDGRLLSRMRTGHAAPTQGALTFKIDGALHTDAVSPSLTYLGNAGFPGAYVHLAPGDHTLVVTATGSTTTVASAAFKVDYASDSTELLLEPSVASPIPGLAAVLDPDGPFPPTPATARLRLHHAARGISSQVLDLYLNSVSGSPLIRNIAFSKVSPYVEVPAGSGQSLYLTPAGNPGSVLYTLTSVTLEAGRDASLVALATSNATHLTESVLVADN